jgi:hypothetical protein
VRQNNSLRHHGEPIHAFDRRNSTASQRFAASWSRRRLLRVHRRKFTVVCTRIVTMAGSKRIGEQIDLVKQVMEAVQTGDPNRIPPEVYEPIRKAVETLKNLKLEDG